MAYLAETDLLLVKRFPASAGSFYGKMLGLTISAFYVRDRLVELEPIDPIEELGQGAELILIILTFLGSSAHTDSSFFLGRAFYVL